MYYNKYNMKYYICICNISTMERAIASKISMTWEDPAVTVYFAWILFVVFSRDFLILLLSSSAAQSHFLSQFLLDGGSVGVPQYLYNIRAQTYGNNRAECLVPPLLVESMSLASTTQQARDHLFEERGTVTAEAVVRHVDSSSLSEDDVFYN